MSVYRFPPRRKLHHAWCTCSVCCPCLYEAAGRYCARGRCARCDLRRMGDQEWARALVVLATVVAAIFLAGVVVGLLAAGCS